MSMNIKEFHFSPPPNLAGGQNSLTLRISHQTDAYDGMPPKCKKLREDSFDVKKGQSPLIIRPDYCVALKGDIKIEFYQKTKIREEKLFQFWFNTYFVSDRVSGGAANGYVTSAGVGDDLYELCFQKSQLDIVNKKDKQNKQFSADFQVSIRYSSAEQTYYFPILDKKLIVWAMLLHNKLLETKPSITEKCCLT